MDVGKGWGRGVGDALPSIPPAEAEGSSADLQSRMETT